MEWRLDVDADGRGMQSEREVRMSLQQVWIIPSRSLATSPKGLTRTFMTSLCGESESGNKSRAHQ